MYKGLLRSLLWSSDLHSIDTESVFANCLAYQIVDVVFALQLLAELACVEPIVVAFGPHQLGVRAHLGNLASFDDQNAISPSDGRKTVRNHEAGTALHERF